MTTDAAFNSKHPRGQADNKGQFTEAAKDHPGIDILTTGDTNGHICTTCGLWVFQSDQPRSTTRNFGVTPTPASCLNVGHTMDLTEQVDGDDIEVGDLIIYDHQILRVTTWTSETDFEPGFHADFDPDNEGWIFDATPIAGGDEQLEMRLGGDEDIHRIVPPSCSNCGAYLGELHADSPEDHLCDMCAAGRRAGEYL